VQDSAEVVEVVVTVRVEEVKVVDKEVDEEVEEGVLSRAPVISADRRVTGATNVPGDRQRRKAGVDRD
jgi:hypothetical protein